MSSAGYSGTPLAKKLGIKEGHNIKLIGIPDNYYDLFDNFPVDIKCEENELKDFIHVFSKSWVELECLLPQLRKDIVQNGMIWVSWPKKASKVDTDISEDLIREFALSIGLVDVKVCAIDNIWSGLKLVIPVKLRR
ncbi:MAG: hypothetical protein R2800_03015 [Flavipsychrobacter sp.]